MYGDWRADRLGDRRCEFQTAHQVCRVLRGKNQSARAACVFTRSRYRAHGVIPTIVFQGRSSFHYSQCPRCPQLTPSQRTMRVDTDAEQPPLHRQNHRRPDVAALPYAAVDKHHHVLVVTRNGTEGRVLVSRLPLAEYSVVREPSRSQIEHWSSRNPQTPSSQRYSLTGLRKWLKAQLATCDPCLRATVSAKRKWMPAYMRASTTSSAASENRVYVRVFWIT